MYNNVKEIPIGTVLKEYCKQFNCTNQIVKVSDDSTGLNREIAYFNFTDNRNGKNFQMAIWQHEIDNGNIKLY
jgi:hypothetical protein